MREVKFTGSIISVSTFSVYTCSCSYWWKDNRVANKTVGQTCYHPPYFWGLPRRKKGIPSSFYLCLLILFDSYGSHSFHGKESSYNSICKNSHK